MVTDPAKAWQVPKVTGLRRRICMELKAVSAFRAEAIT